MMQTTTKREYRISKEIRDLCLYARHDVPCDPPFSRLDLISCRNLLIYLDEVAQRRILRTPHYDGLSQPDRPVSPTRRTLPSPPAAPTCGRPPATSIGR